VERSTDFGFERVPEHEKAARVSALFDSVAPRYDLMNDLMSGGLHRIWKRFAVAAARPRPGERLLDLASGSGDLARLAARRGAAVWLCDRNARMLALGRDRLLDEGLLLPAVRADGERLPFAEASFHCVTVGFGLRNMTRKEGALAEAYRVLRPAGRVVVLEFSRVERALAPLYDLYSFRLLPWLGELVAGHGQAYRYLAESIRQHPDAASLAAMMERAGFERVEWFRLTAGVVAVHRGWKLR